MKSFYYQAFRSVIATVLIATAALTIAGCPSQSQIAGLVNVLGTDAATIATLQGNPTVAAKLTADTAAAVTAVDNWKSGTSSQEAVEALNLVIADLNLIPQAGPYATYIVLAVTTAQTIITLLQPSTGIATASAKVAVPTVKQFKQSCLKLNLPNSAAVCK